ncbi:unnamed protein product [Urochloa humidicola]
MPRGLPPHRTPVHLPNPQRLHLHLATASSSARHHHRLLLAAATASSSSPLAPARSGGRVRGQGLRRWSGCAGLTGWRRILLLLDLRLLLALRVGTLAVGWSCVRRGRANEASWLSELRSQTLYASLLIWDLMNLVDHGQNTFAQTFSGQPMQLKGSFGPKLDALLGNHLAPNFSDSVCKDLEALVLPTDCFLFRIQEGYQSFGVSEGELFKVLRMQQMVPLNSDKRTLSHHRKRAAACSEKEY